MYANIFNLLKKKLTHYSLSCRKGCKTYRDENKAAINSMQLRHISRKQYFKKIKKNYDIYSSKEHKQSYIRIITVSGYSTGEYKKIKPIYQYFPYR